MRNVSPTHIPCAPPHAPLCDFTAERVRSARNVSTTHTPCTPPHTPCTPPHAPPHAPHAPCTVLYLHTAPRPTPSNCRQPAIVYCGELPSTPYKLMVHPHAPH